MDQISKLRWVVLVAIASACGAEASDETGMSTAGEGDASPHSVEAEPEPSNELDIGLGDGTQDDAGPSSDSTPTHAADVEVSTIDANGESSLADAAPDLAPSLDAGDLESEDPELGSQVLADPEPASLDASAPDPNTDDAVPPEIDWSQCAIQSSTAVYACETSINCPEASGHAVCGPGPNCGCTVGDQEVGTILEAVEGVATCERLAKACMRSTPPVFPNTYPCEPATEVAFGDTCSMDTVCYDKAPLADGFNAVDVRVKDIECNDGGAGLSICICTDINEVTHSEQVLLHASISDACGSAFELCFNDDEPVLGEQTCSTYEQLQTAERCADTQQCQRPTTIEGVEVGVVEINGIECDARDDGSWTCRCDRGDEYRQFVVPAEQDDAICTNASPSCEPALAAELTSDLVCELTNLYDSPPSSCNASLTCTQSGAAGELVVFRESRHSASCGEITPGGDQWSCGCDARSAFVTPPEGVTGVDACLAGVALCANLVAKELNESNPPEVVIADVSE